MLFRRPLTVLAVATLLVLAGCGSAGGPASAPTPTTETPTTTEAPQGATTTTQTQGAASTTTQAVTTPEGTLEVHFINVDQSVSTLIIGPTGETMLIDTGDFTDDGEFVLQYLQRHDIERIDSLVVSHNDADHIGGNAAVIEYYETEADGIGAIYDPGIAASTQTYQEYLDAVEEHDVTLYETREGDSIRFEGVDVQVLGPPEPYLESEARNENSIVLKLTFGETDFLFTGDAEDDQEEYLVNQYGAQLQATVLKAGHHGSKSSTGGALLDAVQPKAAVISSGYDSRYGHPHEETLRRLAERSIPTYWTATHGNIVLESDGASIAVRTQQAAPTEPLSLREADSVAPGTTSSVTQRATITAGTGQVSTTAIADGGTTTTETTSGETGLTVADVNADAAGDDRDNLNDEYIVFKNIGDTDLDLSGWTVADAADHTYTFPDGTTLAAGATLTLHTGSGEDTTTDYYWGAGAPIWNNGGDTIIVTSADGERVLTEEYN